MHLVKSQVITLPEISVLVPVYNRARFIERCIRSLLNQETDVSFEIICINDGSQDNTRDILSKFEKEIKIIELSTNSGLPSALNFGLKESSGRFIVRVDSDDYVSTRFIDLLNYTLVSNPKFHAVACDYITFNNEGEENLISCEESPIACGIMFRKESLLQVGGYNEKFKMHEDKELRTRFDKEYNVVRLPIPLYRYHLHSDSMTNDEEKSSFFLRLLSEMRKM